MKLTANTQTKANMSAYIETPLPMVLIRVVFLVYLFLLLVVLPLVFHTGYVDIADTKWKYYKLFTVGYISDYGIMIFPGCAVILIVLFIWYVIDKKRNGIPLRKPLITDYFAIAYMIVCCISTILAPVKSVVVEGYPGYYMGLYAQLSFCMLYLFASNICYSPSKEYIDSKGNNKSKSAHSVKEFFLTDQYLELIPWIIIVFMMIGSAPVMYIGINNALHIDVMKMAEVSATPVNTFKSTIGNAGIYSEYLTIMLVAGIYVFCYSKKTWSIIVSGLWLILGFIAAECAGAVAGAVGVVIALFVFFVLSIRSLTRLVRYIPVFIIIAFSLMLTGKLAYDDNGHQIMTSEWLFLTKTRVWLPMLVAGIVITIIIYIIMHVRNKEKKSANGIIATIIQVFVVICFLGALYCLFYYMKMNTNGTLPQWLPSSDNPNLILSDTWGSHRIDIWRTVLASFKDVYESDLKLRFWGLGPDNLYILPGMTELGSRVWGPNSIVAYAHNELINIYVNMGLLGIVSYAGVFITSAILLISNNPLRVKDSSNLSNREIDNTVGYREYLLRSAENPSRILALTAMFGYLAQGFFGYQWVCVTTATFIILGMGVARYRK